MAKLTLDPAPTFSAPVPIPIHGGEPVSVSMTFRHRTKTEINEWRDTLSDKEDADAILDMIVGWELDDELSRENVVRLTENYSGSTMAILRTYLAEITQARIKN
jgi:hypothetical protein